MECKVLDLGLREYAEVYDLQKRMVELRVKGEIEDTLILVEHPPVITIGRRGSRRNILISESRLREMGIKVFEVERGGDVTLHCPGQVVGYPILDLTRHGRDLYKYLRNLETVIIRLLKEYNIQAVSNRGHRGVWVGKANIVSLGIACRRWITWHGFSLNVNPDLTYFSLINPCGIANGEVTSMAKIFGETISYNGINPRLIHHFGEVFNLQMKETKCPESIIF